MSADNYVGRPKQSNCNTTHYTDAVVQAATVHINC